MAYKLTATVVSALAMMPSFVSAAQNHNAPRANTNSSQKGNPFTNEFAKFASDILGQWKVPGISLAVVDGDETFAEGYGFATLPDTKVTPDTLFYAGSTTKAFTAATLAHLVNAGNHSLITDGWSTPISSIIRDDFVLSDDWATEHITLEDAAVHRTGMPRHDSSWPLRVNGKPATTRDVVRTFRNLPLSTEPRLGLQYCNIMYVALSYVIEVLTGKFLGDAMRELIWEPLGMNATFTSLEGAQNAAEHLASGYMWDGGEFKNIAFEDTRPFSGAGFIISNAVDYAKWVKCLLHSGEPFSKETHKDIRTPRIIDADDPNLVGDIALYGLAWGRTYAHEKVVISHGGTETAYGAQVYWLPEVNFGVVAFANAADGSNPAAQVLIWELIENKLQIPTKDRFNMNERLKKDEGGDEDEPENPDDQVFPDRPKTPTPSPVDVKELVGTYADAGYGALNLRQEQSGNQTILVADRKDFVEASQYRIHHVSSNFWNVHTFSYATNSTDGYMAAEFRIGVDGKPTELSIQFTSPDEIGEGTVSFQRVDSGSDK